MLKLNEGSEILIQK